MGEFIMLGLIFMLLVTDDTLTGRFRWVIFFIFLYVLSTNSIVTYNRNTLDIINEKLNVVIQVNSGLTVEQLEQLK